MFASSGMHCIVVDESGDFENLVIYNFDARMRMPNETYLLVKEPHLQMFGLEEKHFWLRVDSPSDLVVGKTLDDFTQSVDNLIELGI